MKTNIRRFILAIPLFLISVNGLSAGPDTTSFTLNGESIDPYWHRTLESLHIDQDRILVSIEGLVLIMDSASSYEFNGDLRKDGKLYHKVGDDSHLVGLIVQNIYKDETKSKIDPFSDLQPVDMEYVSGICFKAEPSDHALDLMSHLNIGQAMLTLTDRAAIGDPKSLPDIPNTFSFLRIDESSSNGIKDYSRLASLDSLLYLEVDSLGFPTIDIEDISKNKMLRHLNLGGNRLKNVSAFSALENLRFLNLSWCSELSESDFLADLFELRELQMRRSGIRSLESLEGHTNISVVNANMAAIKKLPKGRLPGLAELNLLSTKVRESDINAFSQANPQCQINHTWTSALRSTLAGVDLLRIRSGGTCHRDPSREKTLLELVDTAAIEEIVSRIEMDESDSGFHCMCCGSPSFEFYKGPHLLATLGFHHGKSLRWPNGKWPGDGLLTQESGDHLIHWLADKGVEGPLKEIEATKLRKASRKAKLERATAGLPNSIKVALENGKFSQSLKKAYKQDEEQVAALLFMLGASNDSWSMEDNLEQIAGETLSTYSIEVLGNAIQSALLGDNRQRRRGAARFWQSWRSPLEDWSPPNIARLLSTVLTIQQESRYYPLRLEAIKNLADWADELDSSDFQKRFQAALLDPHSSVRKKAMIEASVIGYEGSIPHLLKALRREAIDLNTLPDVPKDETIGILSGFDDVAGNREEHEAAALALGYLRYSPAIDEIKAMKDSPMKDVALALFGETDRLTAKHFNLEESNQELQLAAVEAVIRAKGQVGLNWAVEYKQATHWWESEYVAKRLKQMLTDNNAPGASLLSEEPSLEELKGWHQRYSESYLEQISQ